MPDPVDLSHAISLKPKDTIAYFRAKGYRISWNWKDTWQEAHAKAFTVAKAARMDVLKDIRTEVDYAIANGLDERAFIKRLTPTLKQKGWWGKKKIIGADGRPRTVQLGSTHRLKTIFRTNMQTAYMAGQYKIMMEEREERPYWQYIAVMDGRTRPAHRNLHGRIFRWDDPIWKAIFPPNGFRCRCRTSTLSEFALKREGLTVSSSKGKLKEEMRLVSIDSKTGEGIYKPVMVYRWPGPDGKMQQFEPDPGWSYNPGAAAWRPDLERYPYETARQYLKGSVTGPDFSHFVETATTGTMAVAVLKKEHQTLLDTTSRVVLLSGESMEKQRAQHPELTTAEYAALPDLIAKGEVVRQGDLKLVYFRFNGRLYKAVIKSTKDRKELYLVSFHRADEREMQREIKRGEKMK